MTYGRSSKYGTVVPMVARHMVVVPMVPSTSPVPRMSAVPMVTRHMATIPIMCPMIGHIMLLQHPSIVANETCLKLPHVGVKWLKVANATSL